MTDLARQVTIEAPTTRELVDTQDGYLQLSGGVPVTVYIQLDTTKQKVGFASSLGGPYYNYGISWQCGGYPLIITFVFVDTAIIELAPVTPAFWFSETFTQGGNTQQGCCVPPTSGTYDFNAMVSDLIAGIKKLIDPKIVVTPLSSTTPRIGRA